MDNWTIHLIRSAVKISQAMLQIFIIRVSFDDLWWNWNMMNKLVKFDIYVNGIVIRYCFRWLDGVRAMDYTFTLLSIPRTYLYL